MTIARNKITSTCVIIGAAAFMPSTMITSAALLTSHFVTRVIYSFPF